MIYLTNDMYRQINKLVIKRYSPREPVGVVHPQVIESLNETLKSEYFGQELYPTVFDKAAIIMIEICKSHPFLNANKRTALMAMLQFLQVNGYEFIMEKEELIQFTLNITLHNMTESDSFDELKKLVSNTVEAHSKLIRDNP